MVLFHSFPSKTNQPVLGFLSDSQGVLVQLAGALGDFSGENREVSSLDRALEMLALLVQLQKRLGVCDRAAKVESHLEKRSVGGGRYQDTQRNAFWLVFRYMKPPKKHGTFGCLGSLFCLILGDF